MTVGVLWLSVVEVGNYCDDRLGQMPSGFRQRDAHVHRDHFRDDISDDIGITQRHSIDLRDREIRSGPWFVWTGARTMLGHVGGRRCRAVRHRVVSNEILGA